MYGSFWLLVVKRRYDNVYNEGTSGITGANLWYQ